MINNIRLNEHFVLSEFQDSITGEVKLDSILAAILVVCRKKINKPFIINSGYRTKKTNELVGGSPKSQHLLGKAVDVHIDGGLIEDYEKLEKLAVEFGAKGIGRNYPAFIHIDVRDQKNVSYWSY